MPLEQELKGVGVAGPGAINQMQRRLRITRVVARLSEGSGGPLRSSVIEGAEGGLHLSSPCGASVGWRRSFCPDSARAAFSRVGVTGCDVPTLLGVAFVIGASACANRPTDPSSFVRLELDLPSQIAPGESRPLVARAIRADSLIRHVTTQATWTQKTGAETASLTLTATGPTATGIRPGSFLVSASLGGFTAEGESPRPAAGYVPSDRPGQYQRAPLPDATVSVITGAGEGLTGRSDAAGK